MVFDWKIIVTLIVVFIALAYLIGTSPPVGNFFESVKERFKIGPIIRTETKGNVEFFLSWDNYKDTQIDDKRTVNITINARSFSANTGNGNIDVAEKTVFVTRFKGTGNITGKEIVLNGRYEELKIQDFGIFYNSTFKASSSFSTAEINNLAFAKLILEGSGTISYKGTELAVNDQTAELTSVSGTFVFGEGLQINGTAASIKAGDIEIK
jgi:hypothetical protein